MRNWLNRQAVGALDNLPRGLYLFSHGVATEIHRQERAPLQSSHSVPRSQCRRGALRCLLAPASDSMQSAVQCKCNGAGNIKTRPLLAPLRTPKGAVCHFFK